MGNCNCKQGTNGTGAVCTECDILQLARNNYFTGKLLVERDFTDEQRYTMGKLRRHNQKLHGWGTVCGLKVMQHPNPTCRNQYVVVEPGTAIDCCGREILLNCEEYFDFEAKFLANWQKQNPTNPQPGSTPCQLQICISYKECPTEKVPALFDDCAGGGACQPNRILESHCLDVIVAGPSSPTDPPGVQLQWDFTENIANVVKVAENDQSGRLYVLTSGNSSSGGAPTATLYLIDTANYSFLTPVSFLGSQGLDVAVSGSGDFVYVAVQPTTTTGGTTTASGAPQLYVYKTTSSATALTAVGSAPLPIAATSGSTTPDTTVRLAVFPGTEGSLFSFGTQTGVLAWSGLNAASPTPTPTAVTAITAPVALVVSADNQYAYVASGSTSNTISALSLSASPFTVAATIGLSPTTTAAPTSLAVAGTTKGSTLAALDTTAQILYFVDISKSGPAAGTTVVNTQDTTFAYPSTQVSLSPGARWAYVLEQDSSGNLYVQPVDEHAVELAAGNYLGAAISVGAGPVPSTVSLSETISNDGTHLYIPFQGTSSVPGGVAIVNVLQQDCGDIFQTVIDWCPDCAEGNCLVLATINNYVYGDYVTDPTSGSPIGNDQIDNLTDRRLLVSTDVLTRAVQCLLDQGGNAGLQGPQGPVGPQGLAGLNGTNGTNGAQGATGATGATGPGLQTGLVQISGLSWLHGQNISQLFMTTLLTPLASASPESGGGGTVYQGFTAFVPPLPAGTQVTVGGFTNGVNNGTFTVVSCEENILTLNNNGVSETLPASDSATATAQLPSFVIAFTGDVQVPVATDWTHIFQVLFDPNAAQNLLNGYENLCPVAGYIVPVTATPAGATQITAATQIPEFPTYAQALAFVFNTSTPVFRNMPDGLDIWIRLRGDFLLDATGRAISAEFVGAYLPTGEQPALSDVGLQGGTFESWVEYSSTT